jgi:hypothetical protein
MLVSLVQSALHKCTSLLFRMLGAIIGRDVGGVGPAVNDAAAAGASGAATVAGNSADEGDWNLTLVDPLAELAEPLKSRESRRVQFLGVMSVASRHTALNARHHRGLDMRAQCCDMWERGAGG